MIGREALAAQVALAILGEALAGDEEAVELLTVLRTRVDAQAAKAAAVIDENGNITIGLRPVGLTAASAAVAR